MVVVVIVVKGGWLWYAYSLLISNRWCLLGVNTGGLWCLKHLSPPPPTSADEETKTEDITGGRNKTCGC